MRKFANYPIVINYNLHMQSRNVDSEIDDLHTIFWQYTEERKRYVHTITTSDSSLDAKRWKKEIDQYETSVLRCLHKIDSVPVGKMVLGLINKRTTGSIPSLMPISRPARAR